MSHYFLAKSGWDFFDVSRAYGLGSIINALSGDATITETGSFYLIKSKKEDLNFENVEKIAGYFIKEECEGILSTLKGKNRDKKIKKIQKALTAKTEIEELVKEYSKPNKPTLISTIKNKDFSETLYLSMEPAAVKGIRHEIILRKKYDEGSQVYIPKYDFYLSFLGHLQFTMRKWIENKNILIIPTPLNTKIVHSREIIPRLKETIKGHNGGWFVTVAWTATNLVKEELEGKKQEKFIPRFKSLIYGVLEGTGHQLKPLTGGIFPLDHLHRIAQSKNGQDVLNMWHKIFKRTWKKGYEELAISLAKFIDDPSFSNYENYLNIHIRNEMDENRIKMGVYEKKSLEEVIKMSNFELKKVLENSGVKGFGRILRNMLRPPRENNKLKWPSDYASLVELRYVETKEEFVDVIARLLRRYDIIARDHKLTRPQEGELEKLMEAVDKYGVKAVRASIITHALVKAGT
ncbi:MAG: hypothetical protein QXL14_00120 [Candidatus Aenigmatarchaeota archaeon]